MRRRNLKCAQTTGGNHLTELEMTKEIIIAMIQTGGIAFSSANGCDEALKLNTSVSNAKAVTVALETVYAGIIETEEKPR